VRSDLFSTIVAAFAATGLSACGPGLGDFSLGGDGGSEHIESYQTVWSEDDNAFAYMRFSGEISEGFLSMAYSTQNLKYEVFISDRQQKKAKSLMTGQAESILSIWDVKHYMREAGYLLVRHEEFASGAPARYLRVTLDGEIVVAGNESGLEMLPSPDGSRIAEVRGSFNSFGCAYPTLQTIVTCNFRIRFLNAATLQPEWAADSVVFEYGGESGGVLRSKPVPVWSPEGEFFLTNEHEAVRVVPGQAAVRQGPRVCRDPATSSSRVSKSRELIAWSGKTKKPFAFVPAHDSVKTFGCL
jgi:hypothetical protein